MARTNGTLPAPPPERVSQPAHGNGASSNFLIWRDGRPKRWTATEWQFIMWMAFLVGGIFRMDRESP